MSPSKRKVASLTPTGAKQVLVRHGFSDFDSYGVGYYRAATGNLDAPDYIPQGSVRVWRTMKHAPGLSLQHRDAERRAAGCPNDGPESARLSLPMEAA